MMGRTFRQLFETIKESNNLHELLNESNKVSLKVYIDDMVAYEGRSYYDFIQVLNEEYVEEFVSEVINIMWCGWNTDYFTCRGTQHKVEVYLV